MEAYRGLDRLLIIPSSDTRPGLRDRHFVTAIDAAVAAGVGQIVMISSAATRQVDEREMFAAYFTGGAASDAYGAALGHPAHELLRRVLRATGGDVARRRDLPALGENRVAFVSRRLRPGC